MLRLKKTKNACLIWGLAFGLGLLAPGCGQKMDGLTEGTENNLDFIPEYGMTVDEAQRYINENSCVIDGKYEKFVDTNDNGICDPLEVEYEKDPEFKCGAEGDPNCKPPELNAEYNDWQRKGIAPMWAIAAAGVGVAGGFLARPAIDKAVDKVFGKDQQTGASIQQLLGADGPSFTLEGPYMEIDRQNVEMVYITHVLVGSSRGFKNLVATGFSEEAGFRAVANLEMVTCTRTNIIQGDLSATTSTTYTLEVERSKDKMNRKYTSADQFIRECIRKTGTKGAYVGMRKLKNGTSSKPFMVTRLDPGTVFDLNVDGTEATTASRTVISTNLTNSGENSEKVNVRVSNHSSTSAANNADDSESLALLDAQDTDSKSFESIYQDCLTRSGESTPSKATKRKCAAVASFDPANPGKLSFGAVLSADERDKVQREGITFGITEAESTLSVEVKNAEVLLERIQTALKQAEENLASSKAGDAALEIDD